MAVCRASPDERAAIEANADILKHVARLHHEDSALRHLFADAAKAPALANERPSPEDLIAYVDGTLVEARRRYVEQCAERDPEIEEEIRLLRQLGSNPLTSE